MTSRTHTPKDVQKIIEPWRDSASDYERGFIDGMQKQMQSSVDKAVNRMTQPEPVKIAHKHEWFRTGEMKVGQMRCISCGTWGQEEMPQRPWVGLTKEERHEISMANRPYCADIMAAHEEELKRRNT